MQKKTKKKKKKKTKNEKRNENKNLRQKTTIRGFFVLDVVNPNPCHSEEQPERRRLAWGDWSLDHVLPRRRWPFSSAHYPW